MEGFTLVDGIVAIVVVLSAVLAYSRGFVREALAIGGWIVAAIAAFFFAPSVEPLVKEIPVIDGFLGGNCELAMILAFALVFAVALIVVSLFTPLFSSAVQNSAVSGVDQGLGFLFGVARGLLLVIVALVVYDRLVIGDPIPMVDESRTALLFAELQDRINDAIPEEAPQWIVGRYEELIANCEAAAEAGSDI
ncbi:MAG: CvpA family protein [Paracoccaceae bacterium]|nr:CvpA family protein [Paracoccaceae bacterium]